MSGMSTYSLIEAKPERLTLDPKPDMTAYELATLLPFFLGKMMTEEDWQALGAAQRHLKRDE